MAASTTRSPLDRVERALRAATAGSFPASTMGGVGAWALLVWGTSTPAGWAAMERRPATLETDGVRPGAGMQTTEIQERAREPEPEPERPAPTSTLKACRTGGTHTTMLRAGHPPGTRTPSTIRYSTPPEPGRTAHRTSSTRPTRTAWVETSTAQASGTGLSSGISRLTRRLPRASPVRLPAPPIGGISTVA